LWLSKCFQQAPNTMYIDGVRGKTVSNKRLNDQV
jgi:hypothetical protein